MSRFFSCIFFIFFLTFCTSSGVDFEGDEFEEEEDFIEEEKETSPSMISKTQTNEDDEEDFIDEEDSVDQESAGITGSSEEGFSDSMEDEDSFSSADEFSGVGSETKRIPLNKIPRQPWKKLNQWVNAVYIARTGDSLSSISTTIYGNSAKTDELRNLNAHLKNKEPTVGAKVFYSSPNRPNDGTKFLNYYEDIGAIPSVYDIQPGENIRTVSKKLLGHNNSWKEIWATNFNIKSKGVVEQTVTIRYWSGDSLANAPQAPLPTPEQPPVDEAPPVEAIEEDPFSPPVEEPAPEPAAQPPVPPEESIPPPNPADDPFAPAPEEPLPPAEDPLAPAPQPDPLAEDTIQTQKQVGLDFNSWKVKGSIIILILIGAALWFARLIRKRKSRSEFDFSQTNIDIDSIEE